jgi:hypothetical protein
MHKIEPLIQAISSSLPTVLSWLTARSNQLVTLFVCQIGNVLVNHLSIQLIDIYISTYLYEVIEKSSMYGLDDDAQSFPRYAYSHIPLQLPAAYVNMPKALGAGRGYHVVITTNIPVNKRPEGTIGNSAEGGIETTGGHMGVGVGGIDSVLSDFGPLPSS